MKSTKVGTVKVLGYLLSKSESFLSKSSSNMKVLKVILCLLTTHTMMMVAIERMMPRNAVISVPVRVDAQQQHFCKRFIVSLCSFYVQSQWFYTLWLWLSIPLDHDFWKTKTYCVTNALLMVLGHFGLIVMFSFTVVKNCSQLFVE